MPGPDDNGNIGAEANHHGSENGSKRPHTHQQKHHIGTAKKNPVFHCGIDKPERFQYQVVDIPNLGRVRQRCGRHSRKHICSPMCYFSLGFSMLND